MCVLYYSVGSSVNCQKTNYITPRFPFFYVGPATGTVYQNTSVCRLLVQDWVSSLVDCSATLCTTKLTFGSSIWLSYYHWHHTVFNGSSYVESRRHSTRHIQAGSEAYLLPLKVQKIQESCAISKMNDAPNIWVPWKFLGVPDYAHGYFFQKNYRKTVSEN